MILIISENGDLSTTQIIEWLNILEKKWIRVNNEDKLNIKYIGKDILFTAIDEDFKLSEIKSVWYRRGFLNINSNKTNITELDDYLTKETNDIKDFLYFEFSKMHHLDTIRNAYVNKLIVNSIAENFGLIIPKSYIFSEKECLKNLITNSENKFITKSISGNPLINLDSISIFNFTSKVELKSIKTEFFAPSLVQNYIDKKYELRIFYFKGECYTMAILSQNDEQTKIDFRVYNKTKPNRRVPFKLPENIKNKLDKLMTKLGYDTGSIDMIVTYKNQYVFLEVNPVGQFGMTSFPCNFNVERKIAEYL